MKIKKEMVTEFYRINFVMRSRCQINAMIRFSRASGILTYLTQTSTVLKYMLIPPTARRGHSFLVLDTPGSLTDIIYTQAFSFATEWILRLVDIHVNSSYI